MKSVVTALASSLIVSLLATTACSAPADADAPAAPATGVSGPQSTANERSFCGALTAYPSRCAGTQPTQCGSVIASSCDKLTGGVLSTSLLDAAGECAASAPCGTAPTSCLASSFAKAQPSEAQKALAKAYCDRCVLVGGAACEAAVLDPNGDGSALAKLLLPLGDSLVGALQNACIGATCKVTFPACAQATLAKELASSLSADSAKCVLEAVSGGASSLGTPTGPNGPQGPTGPGGPNGPNGPPPADAGVDDGPAPSDPTEPTYDIVVVDAVIPRVKEDGSSWDPFDGSPDPFVRVGVGVWAGETASVADTFAPRFDTKVLVRLTAEALQQSSIQILDADTIGWDWIGSCDTPIVPASGVQTFVCAPTVGYFAGYSVRYEVVPTP